MFFVVCSLLFVDCCRLLFVISCSSLCKCCLLFVVFRLLCVVWCLLLDVCVCGLMWWGGVASCLLFGGLLCLSFVVA